MPGSQGTRCAQVSPSVGLTADISPHTGAAVEPDSYAEVMGRRKEPTRWPLRWALTLALLAAMVEHLARLHGFEQPAWVDEPERFLDSPWVLSPVPLIRMEALMFAPAAFLRHGAIPDPRDLDRRGGERYEWAPGP